MANVSRHSPTVSVRLVWSKHIFALSEQRTCCTPTMSRMHCTSFLPLRGENVIMIKSRNRSVSVYIVSAHVSYPFFAWFSVRRCRHFKSYYVMTFVLSRIFTTLKLTARVMHLSTYFSVVYFEIYDSCSSLLSSSLFPRSLPFLPASLPLSFLSFLSICPPIRPFIHSFFRPTFISSFPPILNTALLPVRQSFIKLLALS